MTLTIGSLFAGIGGLELGLEWAGLGPVLWQVEKDKYCQKVLAKHWPDVERYDDVCKIKAGTVEPVDLLCGGAPCQDLSSAGKGAGLTGSRSGLWYEFLRLAHELEPAWVVVENVASGASRWVDTVRGNLELIGYETIPIPMSAFDVGAPHLRKRVFIIGRAVETWSLRRWRSGGACTVCNGNGNRKPALPVNAKVAELPGDAAYTNSVGRGKQQECKPGGSCPSEPPYHGEKGALADTNTVGRHGRPGMQRQGRRGESKDSGCWFAKSGIRRAPYGLSHWLDPDWERGVPRTATVVKDRTARFRALGNAVVPQVAQVIGWIVKELI